MALEGRRGAHIYSASSLLTMKTRAIAIWEQICLVVQVNYQRGLTDVTRLTRYLANGKGLLFNAKQIALEKTRPKVPYGPKRSFLFSTVLAQAGVQGTGIHFDRANDLRVDNTEKYDYPN